MTPVEVGKDEIDALIAARWLVVARDGDSPKAIGDAIRRMVADWARAR